MISSPFTLTLADTVTDRDLAPGLTPLRMEFDRRIGQPGSMTCTLTIPDRETAELIRACDPVRTCAYVTLGTDIWWSGIVWSRTITRPRRSQHQVQLRAAGFESYGYRCVPLFLPAPQGEDAFQGARDLMNGMQLTWGSDLGISVDSGNCGVIPDIPGDWGLNSAMSYGKALEELADRENGFEFTIDVTKVGGARLRHMRLGYPRLGRDAAQHTVSSPGAILDWEWPEDGTRGGTRVLVRGGSTSVYGGDKVPLYDATLGPGDDLEDPVDHAHVNAGWPLVDVVVDDSNLTTIPQLRSRIRSELSRLKPAVTVPSVTVRLDQTDITPLHLGDPVNIVIEDDWWTPRLDTVRRMIGLEVTPPTRDTPDQEITIIFEGSDA